MIKTPLSTVIGGAFWTPGATVINGAKLSFEIVMKKLFSNNEQGFFYDPNDLSTMYQDAAGTIPVTAAGQPVGLLFDKSKGLLTTSVIPQTDTFTFTGTGTTAPPSTNSNTSFLGKACVSVTFPQIASGGYIASRASGVSHPITSNTFYKYRYKFALSRKLEAGESLVVYVTGAHGTSQVFLTSTTPENVWIDGESTVFTTVSGANMFTIYATKTNAPVSVYATAFIADTVNIGNHAYQTTPASRPILRQNAVTGAYYLAFDGTDDFLQTAVSLPFPVTAVAPFDFKSKGATKCVLSAGATGYLRSTETVASVHTAPGSTPSANKKKVDVLLHELTGDSINIRTNADGIMMSNVDIPAKNPYLALNKYIGSFSDTHTDLRAAMDLYGMVVIRKMLSTREEAEIRAHFNKRMGI